MKFCPSCTLRVYWNDDRVLYSCGHRFHNTCLLKNKLSIINPTCKFCNNGNIKNYESNKNNRIIKQNKKYKKTELDYNNNIIYYNKDDEPDSDSDSETNTDSELKSNKNINADIVIKNIVLNILIVFLIAFAIWKII
jgi:hypothetical protein